jgi:hypothetical protein
MITLRSPETGRGVDGETIEMAIFKRSNKNELVVVTIFMGVIFAIIYFIAAPILDYFGDGMLGKVFLVALFGLSYLIFPALSRFVSYLLGERPEL